MNDHSVANWRLTRGQFIRAAGTLAAGIAAGPVLAGCGGREPEKPTASKPAELTVMWNEGELADKDIKAFEAANPTIKIKFEPDNPTKLTAMIAAGAPPDVFRTQAPAIPQLIARKIIRPLTEYFNASDVLKPADLAPPNDYYKWDGSAIGKGDIYGLVKDWSPDFTVFLNTKAFKDAKLEVPGHTDRLTYADLRGLADKLATVKKGGRPVYRSFVHSNDYAWFERVVMNMLGEKNQTLYAPDFSSVNLSGNPDAVAILQYFFDLAKAKYDINPRNPSSSYGGQEFVEGKVAMLQYGYWFGGMAESDVTKGNVVMLPAPTWAGVPRDPTITATGGVISARTKNPDAAWTFFEWYMGGKPAEDRAISGWGVPALKSWYDRMPKDTPFNQQRLEVVQQEIGLNTPPIQFNPYLSETAFNDTYKKHLDTALKGDISLTELLTRVEGEINTLIGEGKTRIGG